MANATSFKLAGNDEHGMNPPTAGKRTPIMPYINRPFFENEFNYPVKNYYLAHAARMGYEVFDVKPERQDTSISTRVVRTNNSGSSISMTFAYNATVNENFNSWGGLEVFYSPQNTAATRSRLLSQAVFARTAANGYVRGNFVGQLAGVGMLSNVRMPASLVEGGFMTNFNEAKLMMDPDYQQLIATLTLQGVGDYLDVNYVPVQNTSFPVIRNGSRGNFVKYLQFRLLNYGYFLSTDGVFGPGTESIVKAFQTQNSLTPDGIVGNNTWAKINNLAPTARTLRSGDRGVEVWFLQRKLLSKLYPVTIDGVFGPGTQGAVIQFQNENSLVADGIVGRNTWTAVARIGGGRPLY